MPIVSDQVRGYSNQTELPRERLLQRGGQSLTDSEILSILIGTGSRRASCHQIASTLLHRLGSLAAVLAAKPQDIEGIPGIGPGKLSRIKACGEALRRVNRIESSNQSLQSPLEISAWLLSHLAWRPNEVFGAAFLDGQRRLLQIEELFHGGLGQTSVYPRELVRRALQLNAASLILFHNHPSGVAQPSLADIRLTQNLRSMLAPLEIRIWEHLLVAGPNVVGIGAP